MWKGDFNNLDEIVLHLNVELAILTITQIIILCFGFCNFSELC